MAFSLYPESLKADRPCELYLRSLKRHRVISNVLMALVVVGFVLAVIVDLS